MKVLSVVGNRPQFVKSAPLSLALRDAGVDEVVLHTGQHYDPELSQVFFDELGLAEPAYRLDLHTADPDAMEPRIRDAVQRERPDWVLVYGDTNSTLAGARAAVAEGVPLAHVEAGLRSGDLSMPEERNRIEVDRVAQLLPRARTSARARRSRARATAGRVEVVGDVMRDALDLFTPIALRDAAARTTKPYAVLTLHRAANTEPERLRRILAALGDTGWTFVFPVHPRTRHVMDEHGIAPAPSVEAVDAARLPRDARARRRRVARRRPTPAACRRRRTGCAFRASRCARRPSGWTPSAPARTRSSTPTTRATSARRSSARAFPTTRRRCTATARPPDASWPLCTLRARMSWDIAVIGAGYVGVPLAQTFAEAGHKVVLVDVVPGIVDALNRGESHIEDVPSEALAAARRSRARSARRPTTPRRARRTRS